jgi:hypothetical protein
VLHFHLPVSGKSGVIRVGVAAGVVVRVGTAVTSTADAYHHE